MDPDNEKHQAFIRSTDEKNLRSIFQLIVTKTNEKMVLDLERRRELLKHLLDEESTALESEFTEKVLHAIDDDIIERNNNLRKISEDDAKINEEFRQRKLEQCLMERDPEIREAYKRKNNREFRISLNEQVLENERKKARELKECRYWHAVQKTRTARQEQIDKKHQELKGYYIEERQYTTNLQIQDAEEKRRLEKQAKIEEGKRLDQMLREMRLAEVDREVEERMIKKKKMREETLLEIQNKCLARQEEREREAEEFRNKCKELQRLEREEIEARHEQKLEARREFVKFGVFGRSIQKHKQEIEKMDDYICDETKRVDECTKYKKAIIAQQKKEAEKKYYEEVKEQWCNDLDRRIQEDIERREQWMTYNPYEPHDPPPEVLKARRNQYCRDLTEQIKIDKRVRAEVEAWHEKRNPPAVEKPEEIALLVRKCEFEDYDYLPPHDNWLPIVCDRRVFKAKPPSEMPPCPPSGKPKDHCKDWYFPREDIGPKNAPPFEF